MENRKVNRIDKAQVEKLRKETGFGLMDCKRALNRFNSDFEKAKNWLNTDFLKQVWIMNN
jgi:translation elongation factor EF-Ts